MSTPVAPTWLMLTALASCVMACLGTIWIFYDSAKRADPATVTKTLAVMVSVLALAGAVSPVPGLGRQLGSDIVRMLAYIGIAAGVAALVTVIAYAVGREPVLVTCPQCYQANDPSWTQCPYCGYPEIEAHPEPEGSDDHPQARQTSPAEASPSPSEGSTIIKPPPGRFPDHIAWLTALNGPHAGRDLRLADENRIGRDQDREIVLTGAGVSRRHARLWLEHGAFVIQDMASENGTWVNGRKIEKKTTLHDKDRLTIGDAEFVFVDVGSRRDTGGESMTGGSDLTRAGEDEA